MMLGKWLLNLIHWKRDGMDDFAPDNYLEVISPELRESCSKHKQVKPSTISRAANFGCYLLSIST